MYLRCHSKRASIYRNGTQGWCYRLQPRDQRGVYAQTELLGQCHVRCLVRKDFGKLPTWALMGLKPLRGFLNS